MISVCPIGVRRINKVEFQRGDRVVLTEGLYQGTPGVFETPGVYVALREDVNWAKIKELNNTVRRHAVRWL